MAETVEQIARRLERESGLSLDGGYAFEPGLRVEQLDDLDKLRAIADPRMRQMLWDLYWLAEAREENGDARKQRREDAARMAQEDTTRLLELSKLCLSGQRGPTAKEVAMHILRDQSGAYRQDLQSLRAFEDELRRSNYRRKGAA